MSTYATPTTTCLALKSNEMRFRGDEWASPASCNDNLNAFHALLTFSGSFAVELGVEAARVEAARDSEDPPPKEAVLLLLIEQQYLLAKERSKDLAAADQAEQHGGSSGAAEAVQMLENAAGRGLPLKVSGLGAGWEGVHHSLATHGEGRMLEAVEEVTLAPAQMLGLGRKGRLQVGLDADITVFDPSATTSMSAIRHVVVNGCARTLCSSFVHQLLALCARADHYGYGARVRVCGQAFCGA